MNIFGRWILYGFHSVSQLHGEWRKEKTKNQSLLTPSIMIGNAYNYFLYDFSSIGDEKDTFAAEFVLFCFFVFFSMAIYHHKGKS